jgi:hypothetical protein
VASVGGIQSGSAALGSILRAADDNTAVAATLLNKVAAADKDLVNTLLPVNPSPTGGVDIKA